MSPVVRRFIAEHQSNLGVPGTGHDGRITRERHRSPAHVAAARGAAPSARARASEPAGGARPPHVTVPEHPRRANAEHAAAHPHPQAHGRAHDSLEATIPHVLQVVEADFSPRRAGAPPAEQWKSEAGYSLTYLPFVARAVCHGAREISRTQCEFQRRSSRRAPARQSRHRGGPRSDGLDGSGDQGCRRKNRSASWRRDQRSREPARGNKLKPDDMAEGTYTISNNGAYGTLITAPIISPPQVAILSTDGVRKKPVVIEGPEGDSSDSAGGHARADFRPSCDRRRVFRSVPRPRAQAARERRLGSRDLT